MAQERPAGGSGDEERQRLSERRIASLRRRLAIVDSVRDQVLEEIGRAEQGLRPLLRGGGDSLLQMSTRGALRYDAMQHKVQKHLCAAVERLGRSRGDFGYALEQAMLMLIMTAPGDSPRARRDEILLAAVERGVPRAEVMRVAGAREEALRQALRRARKRKG